MAKIMISELFTVKGYQIVGAFVIDLLIGDPPKIPHPISGIGKIIKFYENKFKKFPLSSEKKKGILFFGAVFGTISILSITFTFLIQRLVQITYLGDLLFLFFISQFLALKGLIQAGKTVENYLKEEHMEKARRALIALVGRDTEKLHKKDIQKAILESYAENLNDGVIAPLFWLFFLGFPGLVLYKTVNTLDSMVGYKDDKYLYFGWFSAKMDDFFNYLSARITALLMIIATTIYLGIEPGKRALKWTLRYAHLHPSPNSGYPESALAGALGVRLLGPAYYQGKLIYKPYLGEDLTSHLEAALFISRKLLYLSSFIWLLILLCFREI